MRSSSCGKCSITHLHTNIHDHQSRWGQALCQPATETSHGCNASCACRRNSSRTLFCRDLDLRQSATGKASPRRPWPLACPIISPIKSDHQSQQSIRARKKAEKQEQQRHYLKEELHAIANGGSPDSFTELIALCPLGSEQTMVVSAKHSIRTEPDNKRQKTKTSHAP